MEKAGEDGLEVLLLLALADRL